MSHHVSPVGDVAIHEACHAHKVEHFSKSLARHGLELNRGRTETLQINVGLLCNNACRHCHLEAGPDRTEVMGLDTINDIVSYAGRVCFNTVDITGGAPELNPNIGYLIKRMAPLCKRLILRSNLTALAQLEPDVLLKLCLMHGVVLTASLPAVSGPQTDSQRGKGVMEASIGTLRKLNELGYGHPETGLELNLVSNPTGAFLPAPQSQAETRFRSEMKRRWGVVFSNLFTFANAPLGRFHSWLQQSGNLVKYMDKLEASFNPCTVQGLMCRTLVSVSWEGYLFDCDFNLALGVYFSGRKIHVSEMDGAPEPGTKILAGDHCYACTAGAGFT